jgi:small-conductance mechanosensitive channel
MAEFWNVVLAIWRQPLIGIGEEPITIGQIVLVLLLLVVGVIGGRIVRRIASQRLTKTKLQPDAAHAVERILFYSILVLVFVTALELLRIPLTAFAFVSGAIAIGVGFGAQNIINNFISGWILMSERPVRIGDFVEIGDAHGVVETIGNRSTRIRRVDGVHLLVPNSALLEQTVVNWTLIDRNIRTSVRIGVAYGSPAGRVAELMLQAIGEHELILKEPPPTVFFDDFGDSALIFEAVFWSNTGNERGLRAIRSDLRFRLTELLAAEGIVIPFPQRDVHLYPATSPSEQIEADMISDSATARLPAVGRRRPQTVASDRER